MAAKNLDKIFYRPAGAALTSPPPITGTYPAATIAGWTPLPGAVAEKPKMGMEPDLESERGDGTTAVSSEKAGAEITIHEFSTANYTAVRTAFLNKKVDILAFDNEQRETVYVAQGVVLHLKVEVPSGGEPYISLTGGRSAGAGITNAPFKPLGA